MSKMYLKNSKKIKIRKRLIIAIILFSLIFFLFFKLSKKFYSYILDYAKIESIKYTSSIINNCLDNKLLQSYDLYKITSNKNEEIEMIDYDPYVVNLYLKEIVTSIETNLKKLEEEQIIVFVPLGSITQNIVLNNFGPKVPIKIKLVGAISANVETKVKEYGINNSLIEMIIKIELKEKIILPVLSENITINSSVPISYKIIKGKIPNYYGSSLGKNSNIYTIPLE